MVNLMSSEHKTAVEIMYLLLLDLTMLTIPGGKERTEPEFRKLFAAGGFQLTRVVATRAEVCVLEGRKQEAPR